VQAMITANDVENYGSELIDMTRRAAREAVGPALHALQQENQTLRQMAASAQRAGIEQALDRSVPNWHEVYQDPRFSTWLSLPDTYSDEVRSQLMRHAVSTGDAARVVRFYLGFLAEHGVSGAQSYRPRQSRQPAPSGNIYTPPTDRGSV
jgi:hypothetical protein